MSVKKITVTALETALKDIMRQTPFEKITVSDITNRCQLNRQTFYYHFPDIFGLLEWMFQQDAEKLMKKYNNIDVWEQGFMELLCYIKKNKAVCMCTLHSLARDELERFVYKDVHRLILGIMDEVGGDLTVEEDGKEFVARFYTLSLCSLVVHWMKNGMKESPEDLIEKLSLTIQGNIRSAMERFAK